MNRKRSATVSIFTLILLVIVTIAPGSTGSAQDPKPERGVIMYPEAPSAPVNAVVDPPVMGQAFISIGPEAFQDWNRSATLDRNNSMLIRPMTPAGVHALDAPLLVPNGVVINQLVAYIVDNDPDHGVKLFLILHAHTLSAGSSTNLAQSTGAVSGIRYIQLVNPSYPAKIDLLTYSYILRVEIDGGANTYLNSMRVDYSYPNISSLPLVQKP